jgi:hypothetical protein
MTMTTALGCATLAILVSFSMAWLLARLSIRAVMWCMPSGAVAATAQPAQGRERS